MRDSDRFCIWLSGVLTWGASYAVLGGAGRRMPEMAEVIEVWAWPIALLIGVANGWLTYRYFKRKRAREGGR